MRKIPAGIHPIRGLMGSCFLLVEGDDGVMIDTGLVGQGTAKLRLRRIWLWPSGFIFRPAARVVPPAPPWLLKVP